MNKKRLCTICARGGSKAVINKNIRTLSGKPLIAYTLEQAKQSKLFSAVVVSSDSEEILQIAKKYGADFTVQRPAELATDTAAKLPAIKHCALEAEKINGGTFDTYVDLDCTSPLRIIADLENAIQLFEAGQADNLISAAKARRSPYFNLVELNNEGYVNLSKKLADPIVRRQDTPKCFDMNASIYIWKRQSLMAATSVFSEKTILYVMPEERSIDIDSELDFKIVEMIMKEKTV